ncbi:MAG: PSD1 domain-containing protein [Pirellulaceae bacterium]|nr:PSD1 domain-containing protein [Pirellulaceae bacterium]
MKSLLPRLLTCLLALFVAAQSRGDDGDDFFERQVRPILAGKCVECHGPEVPENDLRLTSRDELLKGGKSGPAAVERKSAESLLIQAVTRQGKLKMPPDNKLRDDEVAALRKWVDLGLPWPSTPGQAAKPKGEMIVNAADREHWSFRPVTAPLPPLVRDAAWTRQPLDAFVLAKLEAESLEPALRAEKPALLRRLYYDLLGLPPTWDDVQAFNADASPDALERLADRLLASPRYGERWGRHWLDVARFADTKDGVLMYGDDRVRPYAYTYRDYVVRALNADTPFDQFVQDQLAADLIEPKVEPWRLSALGLLTLGRQFDNNNHDVIDDQIDTVTRGFLGMTVACARCHDHKYDPIPTADYYSLYGVFASSEAPQELPLIAEPRDIPGGEDFEKQVGGKREELRKFLDEQYTLLAETARARAGDYLVHVVTKEPDPLETAIYFLSLDPDDLRPPIVARWRHYLETRSQPDDPVLGTWREFMQIAGSPEGYAKAAAAVLEKWKLRPEGVSKGELNPLVKEALLKGPLASKADVARAYGSVLKRVYDESKEAATASPPPNAAARAQLLQMVTSQESPAYFPRSHSWKYMSRQPKDAFGAKVQELDKLAVKSQHAPPRAMVVYDAPNSVDPCVFVRGNPSQRGKTVRRQFLAVLSPSERTPFTGISGRLDLARAISSPDNPLASRVIVNRAWMHHFGEPLVSSPSDFGRRSTPPVQAELLDYLAFRLSHEGWSLKKLHRWIVSSAVWQESSISPPDMTTAAKAKDPENRLLWKMPRRRLEFEAMRDTLLEVSGRLTHRNGGRPVDVTDPQGHLRTIYSLVDRQSLPGVFRAFDFASPDQSIERRSRTMVPQQALFSMNSPFVLEQARSIASLPEIAVIADPAARIKAMYQTVLGRDPNQDQLELALKFVTSMPDAESKLNTWEELAQVLLSANELMYLD